MTKKVLMISSGGGHWVQMLRLVPAVAHHHVIYAATEPTLAGALPAGACFFHVQDGSFGNWWELTRSLISVIRLIAAERPDVVLSTGAAPGFFGILVGRLMGARTIWVDSIANAEQMSMSGRLARPLAQLWITQWENVAAATGARYYGAVV